MTVGSVGWLGEEKSMLFADSTSALQTSKGRWCEKSSVDRSQVTAANDRNARRARRVNLKEQCEW